MRRRGERGQHDYSALEGVSDSELKKEKEKARQLRKTRWWQEKLIKGLCEYCNKQFPPQQLTMDHVVPLSRGGKSSKVNIVPSCKDCNNAKKAKLLIEWDDWQ